MSYKHKPKMKEMPCRHCNKPVTVGWKTKKTPAHIECSVNAASDAATQMHNKSGPLYEAWLVSMRKFLGNQILAPLGGSENVDLPDLELRNRANTVTL